MEGPKHIGKNYKQKGNFDGPFLLFDDLNSARCLRSKKEGCEAACGVDDFIEWTGWGAGLLQIG